LVVGLVGLVGGVDWWVVLLLVVVLLLLTVDWCRLVLIGVVWC
jgi:hypothetical protein